MILRGTLAAGLQKRPHGPGRRHPAADPRQHPRRRRRRVDPNLPPATQPGPGSTTTTTIPVGECGGSPAGARTTRSLPSRGDRGDASANAGTHRSVARGPPGASGAAPIAPTGGRDRAQRPSRARRSSASRAVSSGSSSPRPAGPRVGSCRRDGSAQRLTSTTGTDPRGSRSRAWALVCPVLEDGRRPGGGRARSTSRPSTRRRETGGAAW
jgi:hypothetical protein